MEKRKLKDAIKIFEKKIKKQGRITNARDVQHLKNLKVILKNYDKPSGKPTIAEIKRTTKKDSPSYFDAKTMKMFKQTMKSFKVHKSRKGNFFIYSKGYSYDSRDGKWNFMGYSIQRYTPNGMNSKLNYVSTPYGILKTDADVKKYLG